MSTITCFDTAYNDQFPPDPQAVAAYVDGGIGDQPNFAWACNAFPHAEHLSIALDPVHDAIALDIENGAATPESAAAWYFRQVVRGVVRPVLYASAYTMETAVVPAVTAAGIARPHVRLWTAHYGAGEHICGPRSCGALSIDADGTQWRDDALGRSLDQSLLLADFFGTPAPPSPAPNWQEAALKALPVISQGSTDVQAVRTLQGLLCARGHTVTVDGAFGPATKAALVEFQKLRGLSPDGAVGPATWPALLGV